MKTNPKLYKIDSKGQTRVWWIEYNHEKYRTHSGIDGGKIVVSGWQYPEAKNVGRANETTVEQQVIAEVDAEYTKKQNQGKYHPSVENAATGAKFHECMLADKYDAKKHTKFPYYSQPKLDGIRCLISKDGMQSRQGKPIVSCPHILEALDPFFEKYPNVVLDGELYNHDLKDNFEKIVSLVRKTKPTMSDFIEAAMLVQYHVYDMIDYNRNWNFIDRTEFLKNVLVDELKSPCVKWVDFMIAENEEHILQNLSWNLEAGYEGQMLRVPESLYEGKRSKNLIKHKEFEDGEFEIVSIIEGKGNWAGCAKAVEIRLPDGTTQQSGVRGSLDKLKEILYDADSYVGTEVTVRYQNKTADGKLRFPIVVAFWKGKRDV